MDNLDGLERMSSLRLAELEESLELREEIDRLERGEIRNFDICWTRDKADIIAEVLSNHEFVFYFLLL